MPIISNCINHEWKYSVYKDEDTEAQSIILTDYIKDDTAVCIPEQISGIPVTSIGDETFKNTHIKSVIMPLSIKHIGESAFENCFSLKNISILGDNIQISYNAFYQCVNLTDILFNPNINGNVEADAFRKTGIKRIYIPKGLIFEEDVLAFTECFNLEAITVDSRHGCYTDVDGILYSKNMDTLLQYPMNKKDSSFIIPQSVERIAQEAFANNPNIRKIYAQNVKYIDRAAFENCRNLKEIALSDKIERIMSSYGNDRPIGINTKIKIKGNDEYLKAWAIGCDFPIGNIISSSKLSNFLEQKQTDIMQEK